MLQTSQDLVMAIPSYHDISIWKKPSHLWQIIVIIGFMATEASDPGYHTALINGICREWWISPEWEPNYLGIPNTTNTHDLVKATLSFN